jgi:succinate dehydrogenase/fumarate reductase flavoprotein subunit
MLFAARWSPLLGVVACGRHTGAAEVPAAPDPDVLVIGAGPAGMAAAIAARASGATVRILEREEAPGGSANWAGGGMLFSGSDEQAAAGIVDSPETLLAEWASFTGGDVEDAWVRQFAQENVPMAHDWLATMGVTWTAPTADPSAGVTPRVINVVGGGAGLVAALEAQLPDATFVYRAEATELTRDDAGRVTGVRWRSLADDADHVTRAGAVIVATGGFMHDLERVRAARPDLAGVDLTFGSWPGADGNGLGMLQSVGATTQNLEAIGLYAHGTPAPGSTDELSVSFVGNVPWFNTNGERFVDESTINDFRTGSLRADQPDGRAWMLFDAPLAASGLFASQDPDKRGVALADLDDAGELVSAGDPGGVAAALGVDANALTAAIDAYNLFAEGGAVPDDWRADASLASPVVTPPFYALPVAATVAKAFGGVDVDLSGRVLDTGGQVIPGVYAAGELTGMAGGSLVGEYGFTGSLSAVVLGGRIAGEAATREALGED